MEDKSKKQSKVKNKKKGKTDNQTMKTATDVVHRVLWDEKIAKDLVKIGYLDRFLGILEKPFESFSWEPLDSCDYFTFGVPEHRIQYFKYRNRIVWDKRIRLDDVFGSTGSNITIYDVIDNYDKKGSELDADLDEEDYEDDGVTFTIQDKPGQSNMDIESSGEEDDFDCGRWKNKLRPNFFICQRITSPQFVEKVKLVQARLCEYENLYKDCCTEENILHLTLCTLRIEDALQVTECTAALKDAETELANLLPSDPIRITGLGHFDDRVLYASVELTPALELFVDHLNLILRAKGFQVDSYKEFTPHISLVKVSRPVARRLGTKRINPDLYSEFLDLDFGTVNIDTIYLCSMEKTRDSDGFYISPGHLTFMRQIL